MGATRVERGAAAGALAGCGLVVVGAGPMSEEDLAAAALLADVEGLSADDCLTVDGWVGRQVAGWEAARIGVRARFAAHRAPAGGDAEGAARGFGEFAADELAAEVGVSTGTARNELHLAVELSRRLPGTLAALAAGEVDLRRATAMVQVTGVLSDEQAAEVESRVLAGGARGSHEAFRRVARKTVLRVDPEGAERRRRQARRARGVRVVAEEDGLAEMVSVLSAEHAAAIHQRVTNLAWRAAGPGDDRSLDERRADVFVDLLLGSNREHVTTEVHVRRPGRHADGPRRRSRRPGRPRAGSRRAGPRARRGSHLHLAADAHRPRRRQGPGGLPPSLPVPGATPLHRGPGPDMFLPGVPAASPPVRHRSYEALWRGRLDGGGEP